MSVRITATGSQHVAYEQFGSDSVHTPMHGFFASLSPFFKVLFETSNAFAACLIYFFFLFPPSSVPLLLSRSLTLTLTLLSSLLWLVEDVSNLTASDVMNRVNLGYLQGNSVCCL